MYLVAFVCLFICLSITLLKTLRIDCNEMLWRGPVWYSKKVIKFWRAIWVLIDMMRK